MVYLMKYVWSTGVSKFDLFSISTYSTENEHQSLTRQATARDWERCKVYACRIRRFGVQDGDKIDQMKGATQTDNKTFYLVLGLLSDLDHNEHDGLASDSTPLLTSPNIHSCWLLLYTSNPVPHYSPFLAH